MTHADNVHTLHSICRLRTHTHTHTHTHTFAILASRASQHSCITSTTGCWLSAPPSTPPSLSKKRTAAPTILMLPAVCVYAHMCVCARGLQPVCMPMRVCVRVCAHVCRYCVRVCTINMRRCTQTQTQTQTQAQAQMHTNAPCIYTQH